MNDNQFVITIGDRKKVIFAKILSETNSTTCVISLANTHTNRRLVAEKEVSDLKANHNCSIHTYKIKNHKYKTIHECLVYNFMNTQDRLTFMDNLVKYLVHRRFSNVKKSLQIFELMRTKSKDTWAVSTRKLKENPQATVSPRPKVYYTKEKRNVARESKPISSQLQHPSSSNAQSSSKQRTILQIPVPRTSVNVMNIKKRKTLLDTKQKKQLLYIQKKKLTAQSRPTTRSVTRKTVQSMSLRNSITGS